MLVSDLVPLWTRLFSFVFGALWGSFFNVCIYRWPMGMSVLTPPSRCPACGKDIPWYRNVPLIAYALQRGKAACCGSPLSSRYLVLEALMGVLSLALAERFLLNVELGTPLDVALINFGCFFLFVGGLLVATFTDLEHIYIPDEVSLGGTALGLATLSYRLGYDPVDLAVGAGLGYLVIQVPFIWCWEAFRGHPGMGEGDSKFLMYIGAFLGVKGVFFALVFGALQSLVAYAIARIVGSKSLDAQAVIEKSEAAINQHLSAANSSPLPQPIGSSEALPDESNVDAANTEADLAVGDIDFADGRARLPFGPFLALAALEFLFFGETIVDKYFAFSMWVVGQ